MADQPDQTSNIYALLIGIDGYRPNQLYKDLKGAVRDINLVADYLIFGSTVANTSLILYTFYCLKV
ncbi:hypothetical protein Osc7112_6793 (plasmid) [Oscillatoria nigro-viridis PCC 7112]|uniref:Uncharacterized protein n=1 Tax=Phormidium nigroviride PCC 7112 TaxID=179408 RepID=K9VUK2_9CYAN|nr:hypothetical protein Osc7112_6793 [Oscillatoria nigro-viridis PCC 7112]